ncbi:hypothetical protein AB1N83_011466 [Pleurotus pulmonarius]
MRVLHIRFTAAPHSSFAACIHEASDLTQRQTVRSSTDYPRPSCDQIMCSHLRLHPVTRLAMMMMMGKRISGGFRSRFTLYPPAGTAAEKTDSTRIKTDPVALGKSKLVPSQRLELRCWRDLQTCREHQHPRTPHHLQNHAGVGKSVADVAVRASRNNTFGQLESKSSRWMTEHKAKSRLVKLVTRLQVLRYDMMQHDVRCVTEASPVARINIPSLVLDLEPTSRDLCLRHTSGCSSHPKSSSTIRRGTLSTTF